MKRKPNLFHRVTYLGGSTVSRARLTNFSEYFRLSYLSEECFGYNTSMPRHNYWLSAWIVLGYLAVRFGLDNQWRSVSQYYSYGFELFFSIWVGWIFRKNMRFKVKWSRELVLGLLPAFLGGYLIFFLVRSSGLEIPFDFQSTELIFLLLILAPFLEEMIFRMALWEPIQAISGSPATTLTLTTLFFSIGHLIAWGSVPMAYKPFVLIQALYVILLGLGAGYRRMKSESVLPAIGVHFGFNLGFFVASQLI